MFKTCSDPDFNWVHCLCDSATWVVKEPGKPIGFFYSRLFDDALSPSGLGFAVDAFRIDEDGTLDDFYSDILWDYGAADELIAAYPNKFSCAVRCDGLNPYDIPTSWSQDKGERYRARDTVLAAIDMLTDEADEAGIDACPEFYRNDYISMYLKTQGLGERVCGRSTAHRERGAGVSEDHRQLPRHQTSARRHGDRARLVHSGVGDEEQRRSVGRDQQRDAIAELHPALEEPARHAVRRGLPLAERQRLPTGDVEERDLVRQLGGHEAELVGQQVGHRRLLSRRRRARDSGGVRGAARR